MEIAVADGGSCTEFGMHRHARAARRGRRRVGLAGAAFVDPLGLVVVAAVVGRPEEEGRELAFVAPRDRAVGGYLSRMGPGDVLDGAGVVARPAGGAQPPDRDRLVELTRQPTSRRPTVSRPGGPSVGQRALKSRRATVDVARQLATRPLTLGRPVDLLRHGGATALGPVPIRRGPTVMLSHLISFLAVVEHGSVTAAARALSYSQPAVSLHVQALEQFYGACLFQRDTRDFTLTSAGAKLLGPAREVVRMLDLAHAAVSSDAGQAPHRTERRAAASGKYILGTPGGATVPEQARRYPPP